MEKPYDWLPDLILLEDFGGDWDAYIDAVYDAFRRDFVASPPRTIEGKRFALKRHPLLLGREATFWHLTSEGNIEQTRTPDLRRCERIRWPRAMIDAPSQGVLRWRNQRSGDDRVLIALPDFSYLVVLADRGDYILLWTAYIVEHEHRRRGLRREYESYSKNG